MAKEKILIIDDDESILTVCREILKRKNYIVKTVSNGREGLRLFEKEDFDLIITDIRMPNCNGLDVIRNIRSYNSVIPIIVFTGYATLEMAISSLRLGAQGFLLKPFNPIELESVVKEALEKVRLLNENIRMRALLPLFEISRQIIGELDIEKLLELLINVTIKETSADSAWIALKEEDSNFLVLKEFYNLKPEFVEKFYDKYQYTISKFFLDDIRVHFVNPENIFSGDYEEIRRVTNASYSIYFPLTIQGSIIGIFCVNKISVPKPFQQSEIEFLTILAGLISSAIQNTKLYRKLEQSYLSTIVTLSGLVEARDFYTDRHMKDIAEYSVEIANRLGLSKSEIDNIRKAALLHDLGKVSIPDNILMKNGRLSEEEMNIIKEHPEIGAKMIESIEPLKYAKDIIKHHQEWFNGSGYPGKLKGNEIPLGARIVAVADAFGAMTTDRPYRKALTVEEAVNELIKNSGTQFDPEIVNIFIAMLREKGIYNNGTCSGDL